MRTPVLGSLNMVAFTEPTLSWATLLSTPLKSSAMVTIRSEMNASVLRATRFLSLMAS